MADVPSRLHRLLLGRCLLAGLLALWAWLAHAAQTNLAGEEAFVPLSGVVETYEDKSAAMAIDEVVGAGGFRSAPRGLRPGFTASAVWLKIELFNRSASPLTRWLAIPSLHLAEVALFARQDGHWRRVEGGSRVPAGQRPVAATQPVFPLALPPLATTQVYVRVASPLPITLAPALWDPLAFRTVESHIRLLDGLMLGGLAVMVLAGVLFAFMFRDRPFVFNALATATYFLGEASAKGYSAFYLWPDAADWGTRCLPLFALLGVGLNILFVRDLLATRRRFPRIDRLLLAVLALQWLPAAGVLFGELQPWAEAAFALNFPATLALLALGAYAMGQGLGVARYYTAAYGVLALGSLTHGLALAGVLSLGRGGEYTLPLAMLIANALLMASVVDRVMLAKKEKVAAQEALLAAHASHEARLQEEVRERTAELEDANARLSGSRRFVQSILDSVASQIAVIDARGVVFAMNDAWRRFPRESCPQPGPGAPATGASYLDICAKCADKPKEGKPGATEGIQAVIDGRLPVFSLEYDCPSAGAPRWFMMTVTPLNSAGQGAVIVHTDISERKRLENEIHQLAFYDPLTSLPNRRLLQDRLEQACVANRRSGGFSALLLLDLDNFKPLNDTYGHGAGDLLLVEAARRLQACVREKDTIARLGGDEFVAIVGDLASDPAELRRQTEGIARKMLACLADNYALTIRREGQEEPTIEHRCSASIGIALFSGDAGETTLEQADAAMYRAKAAGRNAACIAAPPGMDQPWDSIPFSIWENTCS